MRKCWIAMWVGLWWNWRNVIVFGLHISNTTNLWWNLTVVMDVVWSVMKSVTKLAQHHSVRTLFRVSYSSLWIYHRFILRLSHLFGLHGRALILGLNGCNNFCIFFALFSLDSSLPMQWWGRMYLTWIVLHTSNHG
jgi:hypothetical protein